MEAVRPEASAALLAGAVLLGVPPVALLSVRAALDPSTSGEAAVGALVVGSALVAGALAWFRAAPGVVE